MSGVGRRKSAAVAHHQHGWDWRRYLLESRRGANAVLLTVPLLLVYQTGLLIRHGDARNAAHALIEGVLTRMGAPQVLALNVLVLVAFVIAFRRRAVRSATPVGLALPMIVEATVYAALLAPAVVWGVFRPLAMPTLADFPRIDATVLSIGAGFYEELLFRLIGVAGTFVVLKRVVRLSEARSLLLALVGSAATFAAFHHVGAGGEPWNLSRFAFRLLAGLLLGLIFVQRGFGVACYTHTIYNLLIVWTVDRG